MLPAIGAAQELRATGSTKLGSDQLNVSKSDALEVAQIPPVWAEGEDKFTRPDVHAGDRPTGASFFQCAVSIAGTSCQMGRDLS